jgi:hypothetical protein
VYPTANTLPGVGLLEAAEGNSCKKRGTHLPSFGRIKKLRQPVLYRLPQFFYEGWINAGI